MGENDALKTMLMGFIKNKPACIKQILASLEQVATIGRGMDTLQEALENEDAENIDIIKAMIALIKSTRKLAVSAQITGILALIHVDGGEFDTEAIMMLNRMGNGKEALQAAFEQKLKGGK
jgi:hypothetical protein